jgi:uncharacterized Zn finger protein
MQVSPGSVTTEVQGSRVRPYRVRIGIAAFGKAHSTRAEHVLAETLLRPIYLAHGDVKPDRARRLARP